MLYNKSRKTFAERKWGDCSKAVAYCFYKDNVSEEIRNDMVSFGIDEVNFTPVYNRKKVLKSYQLTPIQRISNIYDINGYKLIDTPDGKVYEWDDIIYCSDGYRGYGFPVYINKKALDELKNITGCLNDNTMISLELYNYLIERHPKLEFCPVFIGDIYHNEEYIRLHDTSEGNPNTMVSYSMLEHFSLRGNVRLLGAFKTQEVSQIVKKYAALDEYKRLGGVFFADKSCLIDDKRDRKMFCLWIWREGNFPKWDDDLDDYDYDECYADYHDVYRNKSIALIELDKYLMENKLSKDDVVYTVSEVLLGITYWFE